MSVLRKIFSLPSFLLLTLGAIVSAVALWLSRKNEVSNLRDALRVQKLRQDAFTHRMEVERLKGESNVNVAQLAFAKAELAQHERAAVEIVTGKGSEELSDAEVARLFSDAGL